MPKRHVELDELQYHKPRKVDKRKHHRPGFSEDIQDKRKVRVGFKRYLQEIEERLLDEEIEENT